MEVTDQEVDRKALQLIAQYGPRAAVIAVERLNRYIDERDWASRDTWARIVHRVHENLHDSQSRNER
jgi:hypothetical protein